MDATSIIKFGGSSFLNFHDYSKIALFLSECVRSYPGSKYIVVVSAMSGTTGRLKEAIDSIDPNAPKRVHDGTLATGEIISAHFLEAATSRLGIRCCSLNALNLGLKTNSEFGSAACTEFDLTNISRKLAYNDVIVVAGGQGVSEEQSITMLGRNSSDYTALLLASAVGATHCTIVSDVPGVMSADPYLLPQARTIKSIGFRTMAGVAESGAKVLYGKAVSHAEKFGIEIRCGRFENGEINIYTTIGKESPASIVVVSKAVTIISTESKSDFDNAFEWLELKNQSPLIIDNKKKREIAFVGGDRSSLGKLELLFKDAYSITENAYLVSEHIGLSVIRSSFASHEAAVQHASLRHESLYPSANAEVPEWTEKARSEKSNIFI